MLTHANRSLHNEVTAFTTYNKRTVSVARHGTSEARHNSEYTDLELNRSAPKRTQNNVTFCLIWCRQHPRVVIWLYVRVRRVFIEDINKPPMGRNCFCKRTPRAMLSLAHTSGWYLFQRWPTKRVIFLFIYAETRALWHPSLEILWINLFLCVSRILRPFLAAYFKYANHKKWYCGMKNKIIVKRSQNYGNF